MSEEKTKENQKPNELGKEEPIPLITIEKQYDTDEFGSLEITTEGMEFLMSIKNVNISILSIVGPSKTGKSLLSDFIIGEKDAFPSSKETKGICIWGKPITLENGSILLILDTEGFNNPKSKKGFDKKIMALCLVISSLVIYNTNEDNATSLTNNFINLLNDSIKLFDDYCPKSVVDVNKKYNVLSQLFGKFAFVFREVEGVNENDYIEQIKQNLNKNLKFLEFFQKNLFFTLPTLNLVNEQNFQEIKKKIFDIKTSIFTNIEPKVIGKYDLTGELIFEFLQTIIDDLNKNVEGLVDPLGNFNNTLSLCLMKQASIINSQISLNILHDKGQTKTIFEQTKNIFENVLTDQITKFQNTPIAKIGHSKEIIPSILSLISKGVELYESNLLYAKESFDCLLDKYLCKKEIARFSNVKIENLNAYFSTYTNNLNEVFSSIFDVIPFNTKSKLNTLFKETVTNNLFNVTKEMSSQIDLILKENKELKLEIKSLKVETSNKLNDKEEEISKMRGEIENLDRANKFKELEYMNIVNIEKEKYSQLEEKYKKNFNELEKQLANLELLRKSNNTTSLSSSLSSESQVNLKGSYNKITKTFLEYKAAVDKLQNNQNIFVQNIFIERTVNELEKKYKDKLDVLSDKNLIEKLTNEFESRTELYKKENKILKENFENQVKVAEYYKSKHQELFQNLKNVTELLEIQFNKNVNYQKELKESSELISTLKQKAYENSISIQKKSDIIEEFQIALNTILSTGKISTNLHIDPRFKDPLEALCAKIKI